MESLDYQTLEKSSGAYPENFWFMDGGKAIYNGYYIIDVEEFKKLYSLYDNNATRVKKHWDKEGRRLPVELVYSLRRFLGLPKFKSFNHPCYYPNS